MSVDLPPIDLPGKDYPFEEVFKTAKERLAQIPNLTVFQKFTCENCGERLTMDVPNAFYEKGTCNHCGHVTDIKKNGCNFLAMIGPVEKSAELAKWAGERSDEREAKSREPSS